MSLWLVSNYSFHLYMPICIDRSIDRQQCHTLKVWCFFLFLQVIGVTMSEAWFSHSTKFLHLCVCVWGGGEILLKDPADLVVASWKRQPCFHLNSLGTSWKLWCHVQYPNKVPRGFPSEERQSRNIKYPLLHLTAGIRVFSSLSNFRFYTKTKSSVFVLSDCRTWFQFLLKLDEKNIFFWSLHKIIIYKRLLFKSYVKLLKIKLPITWKYSQREKKRLLLI